MKEDRIADEIYDLYDEYCHGRIDRRQFFRRAGAVAATGVAVAVSGTAAVGATMSCPSCKMHGSHVEPSGTHATTAEGGTAIALMTAGIMSLAFMGFSGMARP